MNVLSVKVFCEPFLLSNVWLMNNEFNVTVYIKLIYTIIMLSLVYFLLKIHFLYAVCLLVDLHVVQVSMMFRLREIALIFIFSCFYFFSYYGMTLFWVEWFILYDFLFSQLTHVVPSILVWVLDINDNAWISFIKFFIYVSQNTSISKMSFGC